MCTGIRVQAGFNNDALLRFRQSLSPAQSGRFRSAVADAPGTVKPISSIASQQLPTIWQLVSVPGLLAHPAPAAIHLTGTDHPSDIAEVEVVVEIVTDTTATQGTTGTAAITTTEDATDTRDLETIVWTEGVLNTLTGLQENVTGHSTLHISHHMRQRLTRLQSI